MKKVELRDSLCIAFDQTKLMCRHYIDLWYDVVRDTSEYYAFNRETLIEA